MKLIFWISLFGAAYSYFLYPLILLALPRHRRTLSEESDAYPFISIIVTVHNEAERIEDKLTNTLQVQYPSDKLEIIVASDASNDATDEIVGRYKERGVLLVRVDDRRGKEYAQLLAINASKGGILVFTDAGARLAPESLGVLREIFLDDKVGAVSSEDRFLDQHGRTAGEGIYVKYEMWLRRLESTVYSLVGLSGSFFAARRQVCTEWDHRVPSDLNVALTCVRQGYVAISDPRIIGSYTDIADEKREYQRKVRTVVRGLSGILQRSDVLNPFAFGFFAFEVWSHKVMRWSVPWFLLGLLGSSIALSAHSVYYVAAIAQICFYTLALMGGLFKNLRGLTLFKVPFFFTQVNVAIAHATAATLLGKRVTVWQPSKR